jgi:hypothetical protein
LITVRHIGHTVAREGPIALSRSGFIHSTAVVQLTKIG